MHTYFLKVTSDYHFILQISESPLCRQLNSVGRHLDCDGLTKFCDPALERLQQMESIYQQHIIELENQLVSTRQQLHQCMTHCNGAGRAIDSSSEGVVRDNFFFNFYCPIIFKILHFIF